METFAEKTVREIAVEEPSSIRVFESLGIDYCCGGKRRLSDVCTQANIDLTNISHLLEAAKQKEQMVAADGWTEKPLSELTAFIVNTHHEYVRRETRRVEGLFAKVISRHGQAHPAITRAQQFFASLSQELAAHMPKEEQVLFPHIERMEQAAQSGVSIPPPFFGTVQRPIGVMMAEHDEAGALLAQIRSLTDNFTPPDGACPTFIALYRALEDFERDLHRHVHLENNVLFPRALVLENAA
jgi:regulator of cell morphogenesis and NO signaling